MTGRCDQCNAYTDVRWTDSQTSKLCGDCVLANDDKRARDIRARERERELHGPSTYQRGGYDWSSTAPETISEKNRRKRYGDPY